MPVARAIHVLKQVCAALREAHGRGLVHRDIKPHNIMLCRRGGEHDVVKILDFGLVKDVEGRQSRDITQFQKMLGTPLYMSPERIRNPATPMRAPTSTRSARSGFYLLTGRELFETTGEHDLTYHVLHTPPRRPSETRPRHAAAARRPHRALPCEGPQRAAARGPGGAGAARSARRSSIRGRSAMRSSGGRTAPRRERRR